MSTSIKKILSLALFCVIVSLVFLLFQSEKAVFQNFIFDSDDLYLPSLFKNIFAENGSIHEWYLTPAPYFFPDYLLFGVSYFFTQKIHYQMAMYTCLQIILLIFSLHFLFKKMLTTEKNIHQNTLSLLPNCMAISTTALLLWLATNQSIYSYLLLSANHYGAFLIELISTTLILDYFQKINTKSIPKYTLFGVFILASITNYSDGLLSAQYIAPISAAYLCTSLVMREKKVKEALVIVAIVIGGIIGYKLYPLFLSHPMRYPNHLQFKQFSINLPYILAIFERILISMPLVALYLACFYIGLVISIPYFAIKKSKRNLFIALFLLFSASTILITLTFIRHFIPADRYFIAFVNWPIILGVYFFTVRIKKFAYLFNICILLSIIFFLGKETGNLSKTNPLQGKYRHPDVLCIDNALSAFPDHKYGIAQYWDAKFIQAHSQNKLVLAQHDRLLSENHWITSSTFFRNLYDFAIINVDSPIDEYKIPRTMITRYSGEPIKTIHCGKHDLLIYGKNKLKTKPISDIGDQTFWKGCELPTRIGKASPNCTVLSKITPKSGYLTFGPYQSLPAGTYRFTLDYKSTKTENELAGRIEVVTAAHVPPTPLSVQPLMGTKNIKRIISGEFMLSQEHHLEKIEIRTYANENQSIKLYRLDLKRLS